MHPQYYYKLTEPETKNTSRRMQWIVGERERPDLSCWVCKKDIQKPSEHVKEMR